MADEPNTRTEPATVAWPLRLLGRGRGGEGRGGQGPVASPSPAPGGTSAPASTVRGAVRSAGRVVLWAVIVLLLVRGLGDVLSGGASGPGAPPAQTREPFPDDAARAFAVGFARVYVENPTAAALRPYLAPEVLEQLAGTQVKRGVPVGQAVVADAQPQAADRATVTVACQLAVQDGRTLHLAVLVARDPAGGLSVIGLPAFVGSQGAGQTEADATEPLSGSDAPQIHALVQRFLGAYLSEAEVGELSYLLAPGAGVAPAGGGLQLVEVSDVGRLEAADVTHLTVVARATVRDPESGATYPVAYRLELVKRDRWYVAGIQGALS